MTGVLVYSFVLGRVVRRLEDRHDEVEATRCSSVIAPLRYSSVIAPLLGGLLFFILRGSLLPGMFRMATLHFASAVFFFICMKRSAALSADVAA